GSVVSRCGARPLDLPSRLTPKGNSDRRPPHLPGILSHEAGTAARILHRVRATRGLVVMVVRQSCEGATPGLVPPLEGRTGVIAVYAACMFIGSLPRIAHGRGPEQSG